MQQGKVVSFSFTCKGRFPSQRWGFPVPRDLKGRSFQVVSIWGLIRVSVGGEGEKQQEGKKGEKNPNQNKKEFGKVP